MILCSLGCRLSGQQQHSGVGSMKKHALKRRLDPPACAANSCSTAEDEPRPAAVTSSSLRHAKKARVSAAMDGSAAPATAEYASLPAIGASHPGAEGQPAVSSKRQCLLRMLKLARAVNAAGSQQVIGAKLHFVCCMFVAGARACSNPVVLHERIHCGKNQSRQRMVASPLLNAANSTYSTNASARTLPGH